MNIKFFQKKKDFIRFIKTLTNKEKFIFNQMKKNYENAIQIFKIIKNDKNKIKINVKNKNKTF